MIVFSFEGLLHHMVVTFFRVTWNWLSIGVTCLYFNLKRENFLSMSEYKKNPIKTECRLNGKALESAGKHWHLRIWVQSTLSWDYHITSICAKARRIIKGLIRRTFGYRSVWLQEFR